MSDNRRMVAPTKPLRVKTTRPDGPPHPRARGNRPRIRPVVSPLRHARKPKLGERLIPQPKTPPRTIAIPQPSGPAQSMPSLDSPEEREPPVRLPVTPPMIAPGPAPKSSIPQICRKMTAIPPLLSPIPATPDHDLLVIETSPIGPQMSTPPTIPWQLHLISPGVAEPSEQRSSPCPSFNNISGITPLRSPKDDGDLSKAIRKLHRSVSPRAEGTAASLPSMVLSPMTSSDRSRLNEFLPWKLPVHPSTSPPTQVVDIRRKGPKLRACYKGREGRISWKNFSPRTLTCSPPSAKDCYFILS